MHKPKQQCSSLLYFQLKGGSIDYIPFHKALVLQGRQEDEELKEELAQLEQVVSDRFDTVNQRFDGIEVCTCVLYLEQLIACIEWIAESFTHTLPAQSNVRNF